MAKIQSWGSAVSRHAQRGVLRRKVRRRSTRSRGDAGLCRRILNATLAHFPMFGCGVIAPTLQPDWCCLPQNDNRRAESARRSALVLVRRSLSPPGGRRGASRGGIQNVGGGDRKEGGDRDHSGGEEVDRKLLPPRSAWAGSTLDPASTPERRWTCVHARGRNSSMAAPRARVTGTPSRTW